MMDVQMPVEMISPVKVQRSATFADLMHVDQMTDPRVPVSFWLIWEPLATVETDVVIGDAERI